MKIKSISIILLFTILISTKTYANEYVDEYTKIENEIVKLNDNLIEYDEIEILVHEKNPSISDAWKKLEEAKQNILMNFEELKDEENNMKTLKESAKNNGDMQSYMNFYIQEEMLKAMADSLKTNGLKQVTNRTVRNQIEKGEKQIVKALKSLICTYENLNNQEELLLELIKLYQNQYQAELKKNSLGLSTYHNAELAKTNIESTKINVETIKNAKTQIKQNICLLLGYPYDFSPIIGVIPDITKEDLNQLKLEEDIEIAISNNSELIEIRHSKVNKTSDHLMVKFEQEKQKEDEIKTKMEYLYNNIKTNENAVKNSEAEAETAKKEFEMYSRMFEVGYLSKNEYIAINIQYLQKQIQLNTNKLNLRTTIEDYQLAKEGILN